MTVALVGAGNLASTMRHVSQSGEQDAAKNEWEPHMKATPFGVGILIFATVVALVCNGLHVNVPVAPEQFIALSVLPISMGILISFSSWVYFGYFVASGDFSRFALG